MAVTPTTMTELSDLAKDYFTEVYVPLQNTDTPLRNQFEKLQDADFTGKKWIFGVKTVNGGGASNAGANKTLPAAAAGSYDQGELTVVRTYTRMALDGLAAEVTKAKRGSFKPAVAELMSDRLTAHDLEINRQIFCNSDGKLCLVASSGAASATQTVEKDFGVANGGNGTRHLITGDQIAVYDSTDTLVGRRTVQSVDNAAGTVTFTATVTTTANTPNYFAKSTADDDNVTGEAIGLLKSVKDSGTLMTIPATGLWKSYRQHNSGTTRPMTDPLALTMIETIRQRSRLVPNLAVTTGGIQLKYSEILLPLRRISGQDQQLKGGYKPITSIMHGGGSIPVIVDNDCPKSRIFWLNTEAFRWADLVGTEWFDLDGAVFSRITDKDGYEGFIRKYWNIATIQRNANGVTEDLEDIDAVDRIAV